MRSPRRKSRIINADALQWLEENDQRYDFVVVDFSRSVELRDRQTPTARPSTGCSKTPDRERAGGGSVDLAALRPSILLVRGDDDRERRPGGDALSCTGAVVRRMGLRPHQPACHLPPASYPVATRFLAPERRRRCSRS